MVDFSISTNRLHSTKSIKSQRCMHGRQLYVGCFLSFSIRVNRYHILFILLLLWQNTQQKKLKKRRVYLNSQFKSIVHHVSRNMTWLLSLYPQSRSSVGAQITLLFLFSLWPKSIGWFWPVLECVFPFYWNPSGNNFIEIPSCVSSGVSDPVKLTISIHCHMHKSSTMKLLCSQDCWLYYP